MRALCACVCVREACVRVRRVRACVCCVRVRACVCVCCVRENARVIIIVVTMLPGLAQCVA